MRNPLRSTQGGGSVGYGGSGQAIGREVGGTRNGSMGTIYVVEQ
jgi:hypothetical protein